MKEYLTRRYKTRAGIIVFTVGMFSLFNILTGNGDVVPAILVAGPFSYLVFGGLFPKEEK